MINIDCLMMFCIGFVIGVFVMAYHAMKEQDRNKLLELRQFVDHALEDYCWSISGPCGGDLQDKAESLGLIELRPCNPDDYEGAKEVYFTKWTPMEGK